MRRLLFVLIVLGAALSPLAPAWAHAVLLDSAPADRAVLAHAPDEIVLRFNEPVQPIAVRLIDADGRQVAADAAVNMRGGALHVALGAPLADGAYVLSYRITSEDSHPVAGSLLFAVGPEPETWRAPAPSEDSPFWLVANGVNRALHLAGLLMLAGGMLFLLVFPGERLAARRALAPLLTKFAALAGVTALLTFGLQGGLLAAAPPADLFKPALWRLGLSGTRGESALFALIAVALLLAALHLGRHKTRQKLFAPCAIAGLIAALAGFVVSGHVATASPRWLTVPALALHVAVAAAWIGSFAPLLRRLARDNKGTLPTIRRFSRYMTTGLPILLICGVAVSAVQLQGVAALTASDYGYLLLAKLGLVAALIGLAANNKLRLTPRLATMPRAKRALERAIAAEIALGLAIVSVTAFLSQTMPPRSAGQHAGHDMAAPLPGYSTVATAGGRMALIAVDPARVGRNRLEIRFSGDGGKPFAPREVSVELTNELAGVEGLRRPLERQADGSYALSGPEFAIAGSWRLRVDALIDDFTQATFYAAIPIAR